MNIELLIENKGVIYAPIITGSVTWETERKGSPSRLKFGVLKDTGVDFTEGNAVRFKVDGNNIFYGFIFAKKRDKQGVIEVLAYDQMRYLKNKDTYIYSGKTASEVVKMIASDFLLNLGTIDNTEYVIPSRVESDTELFDVILNALDLELTNTKNMYILYDDFGKLTLKSLENMKIPLLIDEDTGENFDYSSSIDEDTYNVIKYAYENDQTEGIEVVFSPELAYDKGKKILSESQRQWGVLQYFLKEENIVMNRAQAQSKADALLSLYNVKTRSLKMTKAFGDPRVRAGSMPIVRLDLGDVKLSNFMLVERALHTFREGEHFMDLTLRGGEFVG